MTTLPEDGIYRCAFIRLTLTNCWWVNAMIRFAVTWSVLIHASLLLHNASFGSRHAFNPAISLPSLNGSLFHELLQPFHGIHHHPVDSGDWRAGGGPRAPPASERFDAHTEECRRVLLANVSVVNLLLFGLDQPQTSGHPASKLLDEFLFCQCGHCGTLLTKDASERVRDAISHSVNALLKANKFLLNLK